VSEGSLGGGILQIGTDVLEETAAFIFRIEAFYLEDGGSRSLRNSGGKYLPNNVVSTLRIPQCSLIC
jgi:hypothetical protein